MPAKKKNKAKSAAKPAKRVRQVAAKTKSSRKPAKKRAGRKRVAAKPRIRSRKRRSVSAEAELKREFQSRTLTATGKGSRRRSEDFEGVSRAEQADSESVDELVEEGNTFEAGAVAGVQEADDADEREVRTHELPEDDVPEEYLDKD
jgi:N utilization substance protein A